MKDFRALLVPEAYYHVFNRAIGNEKLFVIADNYRYFFQLFHSYISPVADLFCFSLLPNHFHFFLRTRDATAISTQMEKLNYRHGNAVDLIPDFLLQQFSNCFNAYTKAFNNQQKRKGKLFMEPFNRKTIATPEYYTKIIHYIHANPVHHGFCKKIKEWPYSSYYGLLSGEKGWIKYEEVINWFGSVAEFAKFHDQPIQRKFTRK
jgi:putative transposase